MGHVFEANSSSVLYVDKDATGVADGTSWANAYVDLAQAVFQQSFNEVWVAEGTYLPGTSLSRLSSSAPERSGVRWVCRQRDPPDSTQRVANPTILSGDIGRRGIPAIIPIMLLFLPKVRPWMDSSSKTAMRVRTFPMTTGESGRVLCRRSHLRRLQLYLHGQPFPSKRRSRLPHGLQCDLRGL